jgi:hypothetical protein
MVLAREGLDARRDDDPDWYAGLCAAAPGDLLPSTFLERLAAARPPWQHHAACRGRSDISWFDPESSAAAVSECLTCPVRVECEQAGERERWGVWGGKQRGPRRQGTAARTSAA